VRRGAGSGVLTPATLTRVASRRDLSRKRER
jgi:hypothetical protein